jgi:hypothetical protein
MIINASTDKYNEVLTFYANQLLHPRTVKNITIDLEIDTKADFMAHCVNEDGTKNPRWFTITINPNNVHRQELLTALAHEMVHVKQYCKNELSYIGDGHAWMGEVWKPKKKQNAYYDAPWEVEAYGMEVGLIYKLKEAGIHKLNT